MDEKLPVEEVNFPEGRSSNFLGSVPNGGQLTESGRPASNAIRDKDFCKILAQLKRVRMFLSREALAIESTELVALQLGHLWSIYFDSKGRLPTEGEWEQLDAKIRMAFLQLPVGKRDRYLMTEISPIIIVLPLVFIFMSFLCVLFPTLYSSSYWLSAIMILCYFAWACCLGGLGALAFMAMNVLSVQKDVTFDLLSVRLVSLRIVIGALFAVIISLPFGYIDYSHFCQNLIFAATISPSEGDKGLYSQATWLFAPFVLGFSTPCVISILNQAVVAIQSFLGVLKSNTT